MLWSHLGIHQSQNRSLCVTTQFERSDSIAFDLRINATFLSGASCCSNGLIACNWSLASRFRSRVLLLCDLVRRLLFEFFILLLILLNLLLYLFVLLFFALNLLYQVSVALHELFLRNVLLSFGFVRYASCFRKLLLQCPNFLFK